MEVEKQIRSYDNNLISFRVTPRDYVTLMEGGYAITPDGEFVTVKRDESHSVIFDKYLNSYLGKYRNKYVSEFLGVSEDSEELDVLDFYIIYGILISLNHVIYSGLGKSNDNKDVNLFLPQNYESILTKEEKEACILLLSSNKGNDIRMSICLWDSDEVINEEEFFDKVMMDKSR